MKDEEKEWKMKKKLYGLNMREGKRKREGEREIGKEREITKEVRIKEKKKERMNEEIWGK